MAARLYAGKIWKGMNSEMVKDSWGQRKRSTGKSAEISLRKNGSIRTPGSILKIIPH